MHFLEVRNIASCVDLVIQDITGIEKFTPKISALYSESESHFQQTETIKRMPIRLTDAVKRVVFYRRLFVLPFIANFFSRYSIVVCRWCTSALQHTGSLSSMQKTEVGRARFFVRVDRHRHSPFAMNSEVSGHRLLRWQGNASMSKSLAMTVFQ